MSPATWLRPSWQCLVSNDLCLDVGLPLLSDGVAARSVATFCADVMKLQCGQARQMEAPFLDYGSAPLTVGERMVWHNLSTRQSLIGGETRVPRLQEDFSTAATRHWGDAGALRPGRLESADHHVGISAECALKSALIASGITLPISRSSGYKVHIDSLWGNATAGLDAARFPDLCNLLSGPNPFDTWAVDDRYADSSAILNDIALLGSSGSARWKERLDATGDLLRHAGLMP